MKEVLDGKAIRELRSIMDSRGVDYHSGRNISMLVRRDTQKMVEWLKANPKADVAEMSRKALEINKAR